MKYILNNSERFEIVNSGDDYGMIYVPSSRTLSIDNTEIDDISYIELSPTKIYANHMCDGIHIDTAGSDFFVGSNSSCFSLSEEGQCDIYGQTISIDSDGNIGINGTDSISINGNSLELRCFSSGIKMYAQSGGVEINGSTTITGNGYATAFYETSDENLKDFSDDINVDFNKLKEIRKSYFTWKSDETGKLHIGTSAQDIQKNYPELVSEDKNGNLTVDYAKLSLIALSAIDKLDERLSKIEKMLNIE